MTARRVWLLSLLAPLVASAVAFACGGGNDNLPPPPPPPPPPATASATPVASTTTSATATPPPRPPVTLTPGTASPDPASPTPTVKITAPTRDQVIPADKAGAFEVKLDVKNWQTAVGSSHVHLILDNKPYKAIYDTKAGVKLNDLVAGGEIAEGRHTIVAFPSRANHESVKTKDALTVTTFWVGKKGDAKDDPTKKPMLVYSRPKGDYNGDMGNHVLIDFQLVNETLAEGKDHVNVLVTGPGIDVAGVTAKVTKFGTPLYLDNLQNGSYTLKLELVDGTDKVVEGAWNSTTRTIKIDHDAAMDPSMGHGPTPAASGDAGAPKPAPKDAGAPPKAAPGTPGSPTPATTPSTMGTAPF